MRAGLRGRLERLERHHAGADREVLPPEFWGAISRRIPLDEVAPRTRELMVWIGTPEPEQGNSVTARLRAALAESLGGAPVNGPGWPPDEGG